MMLKVGAVTAAVCSLGLLGYQTMVIIAPRQSAARPAEKTVSLEEARRLAVEAIGDPIDLDAGWGAAPSAAVQHAPALPKRGGFFAGRTSASTPRSVHAAPSTRARATNPSSSKRSPASASARNRSASDFTAALDRGMYKKPHVGFRPFAKGFSSRRR